MLENKVALVYGAGAIGRAATFEHLCDVAVFPASDRAHLMTAATLNISGGSVID